MPRSKAGPHLQLLGVVFKEDGRFTGVLGVKAVGDDVVGRVIVQVGAGFQGYVVGAHGVHGR